MNKKAYISIVMLIFLLLISLFSLYFFNKVNNGLSLLNYYRIGKKNFLRQKFEYEKIIYDKKILESLFSEYIKKNIYTLAGENKKKYGDIQIILRLQRLIREDYKMYAYILASNKNNNYILEANGQIINEIFENQEADRRKINLYINDILENMEELNIKILSKELTDSEIDGNLNLKGIYYLDKLDCLEDIEDKKINLEGILIIDSNSNFPDSNIIINLKGLLLSENEYSFSNINYEYNRNKTYKYARELPNFVDFQMEAIKIY